MDIRQFRSELAKAFSAAGFDKKRVKHSKAAIWVLPGREVERLFWEDAIRRPWGFLLSGSFAIDVPAFRNWLTEKFPQEQHGILWSSILSRHIANEPDMFFAVEEGLPPYRDWVTQIRARLAALPDTVEGLLRAEREPERLSLLWDRWRAPKAWSYFTAWAAGDEPTQPPPRRLPTGQIVNTAVNDPA